ncbi:MAG TPA: NAD(+) synthase [Firmicutes bacterium]|jgi:NAD+ synthase|nr:NAD(+) synthase [Bacillota bacterium]HPT68031.1 NAD(+) synthase [Bacillota bacterium]
MRDYERELRDRIKFIQDVLAAANADGIVYGNSGGKDSALVGILCKKACVNTVGLMMPCGAKRNYNEDRRDAEAVARQFGIELRVVDLTAVRAIMERALAGTTVLTETALLNMAPRLRMTALYAVAASENRLVAGTGNRSESYMGYYTKWGDGAYDFNPIADLTVTEIYEFLRYLKAPESVITKAPSAALFDGQTDEGELGISYQKIDEFLLTGKVSEEDRAIIARYHQASGHKRNLLPAYGWEGA